MLTVNQVRTSALEESLMKLVHEEMAAFFDVVNDREFAQIQRKYSNSRTVLYKVNNY